MDGFKYLLVEVLLLLFLWVVVRSAWKNYQAGGANWPMIGMLPALLKNAGRIHEICAEVLPRYGATFHFRGPWFANMDMLMTVDPENINYIMTENFQNFPKGPKFREIFDILGRGIFNADSEPWRVQRKVTRALITHRRLHLFLAEITRNEVENRLVPLLDMAARERGLVDLQDWFQRFTFDTTCELVTGYNPGCLSENLPDVPFSKALDEAEEAIFMRHIIPERVWKLQRWVGVGSERKMRQARKVLDSVVGKYIDRKRQELTGNVHVHEKEDKGADLLTSYIQSGNDTCNDKFLRDTILNLMIAGRDTTSSALTWFIWLVSTHPSVENKIRDEIESSLPPETHERRRVFGVQETKNLVYIHGAIMEAMRLYPPVPFQHKEPVNPVILPSGHFVDKKMKVLFSLYAMGRMESIWGKDCLEFKPERWISHRGSIKHEPSYKFLAFNAGPRTCLGKEVALSQIKAAAATLIHNYTVRVAEGHPVELNCSIILYMKHGLKVKVTDRLTAN